jgi:hypothetical protein
MLQILLPNQVISVGDYSNRRMISQSDMEIILSNFTTPTSMNEPPELGEIYLLKTKREIRIFTAISIPTRTQDTIPRYEIIYISANEKYSRQFRLGISSSDTSGWPITITKDGTPTLEGWFGRGELFKLNIIDYEQKTLNYSRSGFL